MVSKCTRSLTNQQDITVVMAAAERVIAGMPLHQHRTLQISVDSDSDVESDEVIGKLYFFSIPVFRSLTNWAREMAQWLNLACHASTKTSLNPRIPHKD